jgi:large conductance mechanosensitive channel
MDPLQKVIQSEQAAKAFSLMEEFKNFAFKGNVIDLAVGVIIGGAFGKVVDSLVKSVLMPTISILMPGGGGYSNWKATINGVDTPFGLFIGELVNFLIVAAAMFFFIVKFLGWVMNFKKETAPPAGLTKQEELLTEIRDLLKAGKQL